MSAQTQQPSEKIVKLKLFLEKTKTDFARNNNELLSWLQDRDLKIENLGKYDYEDNLHSKITQNSVDNKVIKEFVPKKTGENFLQKTFSAYKLLQG